MKRPPSKNNMRQIMIIAAAVLGMGLVATIYGVTRDSAPADQRPGADRQLTLARKLMQQEQPEKALAAIEELRGDKKSRTLGETADFLRLQAMERAGMNTRLAADATAFLAAYPSSKVRTDVELMRLSAEVADAGLTKPALLKTVQEFVTKHPAHPGTARLQLALAKQELAIGDTRSAARRLSNLHATLTPEAGEDVRWAVASELGALNMAALMKGETGLGDATYQVAKGDSIWEIAKKFSVTPELLLRVNAISDARMLRVGQTLRVPAVEFALQADISRNEMVLTNRGQYLKTYKVRTGRAAGTTPTGTFRVLNKKTNPVWKPGDGRVYNAGDPNNELGTRWMAFEGDILGIHGTIHPETVGHYASNGCIGMAKEDVEELFDLVSIGTPLTIVGEQDLTRFNVIPAGQVPPPMQDRRVAQAN